jgi:hypothetical protein
MNFLFDYLQHDGILIMFLSCLRVQEVVMEVKKPVENKAGWTGQGEVDGKEKGLIYSADYEGVVMHAGSPPKHKHPKP